MSEVTKEVERTVDHPLAKESSSEERYLSNSDKAKRSDVSATTHQPRVSKIATGTVTRKKETTASKFKKAFFGEDVVNVKDYVIFDVAIPAIKATLSDMIGNGVEVLLFGEARGKRKKRDNDYASYYRRSDSSRGRDRDDRRSSSMNRFDDICLDSRGEAEEVLSSLTDLTYDYGQASVADLYDLVGISASFTDEKYGWYKGDLRGASVRRSRDGFMLELPKPDRLD